MKQNSSKYLFSILFSFYFLVGGLGFNVINYCCNSCENEGIEAVASESCSSVHKHEHIEIEIHNDKDIVCSNLNHHPDSCHLFRLNTDIPLFQQTKIYSDNSFLVDVILSVNFKLFDSNPNLIDLGYEPPPQKFLASSGREIITCNSVLII